jgi:hypothetical protein
MDSGTKVSVAMLVSAIIIALCIFGGVWYVTTQTHNNFNIFVNGNQVNYTESNGTIWITLSSQNVTCNCNCSFNNSCCYGNSTLEKDWYLVFHDPNGQLPDSSPVALTNLPVGDVAYVWLTDDNAGNALVGTNMTFTHANWTGVQKWTGLPDDGSPHTYTIHYSLNYTNPNTGVTFAFSGTDPHEPACYTVVPNTITVPNPT